MPLLPLISKAFKSVQPYLTGFWYSLPVQLLLLHLKKYQVLLVFWYVLFASVQGGFMQRFGARYLFLYPEYLDEVSMLSTGLVGMAFGIFVMCWNITTFILHSRQFRFLAATTQPFLKYCINNAALPLTFLVYYAIRAIRFMRYEELMQPSEILLLMGGFLLGFALVLAASFLYFFGADKTIYRRLSAHSKQLLTQHRHGGLRRVRIKAFEKPRIDWYFSATLRLRQPRKVSHYSPEFLEGIFTQHHLAAVFGVLLVFGSLIGLGFLQDYALFQLPAAGSAMVFFAVGIAVAGALSYFLRAWALAWMALAFLGLNILYKQGILDPRNKAYGLNYSNRPVPVYEEVPLLEQNTLALAQTDSLAWVAMLNAWKQRQPETRPLLVLTAVSGGGSRAATFALQVMRRADSLSGGRYMQQNFLITGASGGMLGAAWYRELYRRQRQGLLTNRYLPAHAEAISKDLLNPLFSSLVSRDLLAPVQHFTYAGKRYVKDRGYAFEQKLNRNTYGWLDRQLQQDAPAEKEGSLPHLLLTAVVTRDGRRLLIANHPVRFLTRPMIRVQEGRNVNPDGIDYQSWFANHQPGQLRLLSALRMNATFPYILPNVWLPSEPVIDVMDAGFRDNTGLELTARFVWTFREWIKANCRAVVVVQIRDKPEGGWQNPYQTTSVADLLTRPALLTQNNLFRFQEFAQLTQWEYVEKYLGKGIQRLVFEYIPQRNQDPASLSFHLTSREKQDIISALDRPNNQSRMQQLLRQWP